MALTLRIENETRLPTGGPLSFRLTGQRGADIGRDPYLDWSLPDSDLFISGKHCEIRWQDGGYVLFDVSRNGTFLYGNDRRLNGPHRLAHGDRLLIGNYIIAVEIDGDEGAVAPRAGRFASPNDDIWATEGSAPPGNRADLVHRNDRPIRPDFLDWAVDVPPVLRSAPSPYPAPPPPPPPPWPSSRPSLVGAPPGAAIWDDPVPAPPRYPGGGHAPVPPPPPETSKTDPSGAVWVDSAPSGRWVSPEAAPAAPGAPEPLGGDDRPAPPPPVTATRADGDLLAVFAAAAGLPPDVFGRRDSVEVMSGIGAMMRLTVERMMALLAARSEAKRAFRSTEHTMIGATDNNPLKFSPTAEDAMRLLLGPRVRSYLDGRAAFTDGFDDLTNHQLRTFAAMQQALKMLMEDLDPATIERATEPDSGLGALVGSRKNRLWDNFVARWQAKTMRNEDGMVGLFMLYFADCYDRLGASARDRS